MTPIVNATTIVTVIVIVTAVVTAVAMVLEVGVGQVEVIVGVQKAI